MTVKSKILGGAFGLEMPDCSLAATEPPFTGQHAQYFLNVRCALKALCDVHRPVSVWLPSYLCASVLEAFEMCGVRVGYYPLDGELNCRDESFLDEIRPGDFLVVIHYFGFPHGVSLAEKAYARGALVIEDASQGLFLKQQFTGSVCILYSARKFLGVPDGAIMVSNRETGTGCLRLAEPPRDWRKLAVAMSLRRREFDLTGRQNDWFTLFRQAECQMPVGHYGASELSIMLLLQGIDYAWIKARRRANYQRLLAGLSEYALFPELGQNLAPLGFPVRVKREWRERVLLHLHEKNIFAATHWPLDGLVPESFRDSHAFAQSSLTLLCDQRYDGEDMERQAAEFKTAVPGMA